MARKTNTIDPERLDRIETRLRRLEEILPLLSPAAVRETPEVKEKRSELRETAALPWQYLVRRDHRWRKQLYLKGRNLTARQLVGSMKANQQTEEQTAADYHLPVEAVREALAYVEQNRELLEIEGEIERLMLGGEESPVALNLYLDDCANADRLADLLRQAGYSVTRPGDVALIVESDEGHFAYARANGLTILTKNPADFLELHEVDSGHHGLLAVYQDNDPTRDMSHAEIVQAIANLEQAAQSGGEPIQGRFHNLNLWRF